eukprot:CAMPEP_0170891148 /NCGR_PEP_ID=MMETSP0734-20130129/40638_1 /TAXON_ID=186038 /ORGANISM="Fragilariopsis kerguelensis, Strain L26-C5" /LENGTH=200 /DNA_ID=CAMNT_0011280367 /DNA_START=470 /DNA_END=1068 /DNA_ORIENTATION=+
MPYVKYTGMRFSNAVVLLGWLPAAVTAGEEPEEDFFQEFMLTKQALKHQFEAAVLMRHPEKNTEHEQGPHFVRQAFLMVLEAHKYLHFCVRSGTTTNQQAQRNERQNTAWKQKQTGMDEELYQEMATLMTHLAHLHLDISELLYFMKVHICGYNEQYDATEATTILRMPPSPNTAAAPPCILRIGSPTPTFKRGRKGKKG